MTMDSTEKENTTDFFITFFLTFQKKGNLSNQVFEIQ